MSTTLKSCLVPWTTSPSSSGLTVTHVEGDYSECSVIFGGGRYDEKGFIDSRRIELTFIDCYYTRTGPHCDSGGIESIGYKINRRFLGDIRDKFAWSQRVYTETGIYPDSNFYVATIN